MWTVNVLKNDLKISKEVWDKIKVVAKENYHYLGYHNGILYPDTDAFEHIDFLWTDWAQAALNDPSVNGVITFGDFEGDNKGKIWGYEFVNGQMKKLKGNIVYEENNG